MVTESGTLVACGLRREKVFHRKDVYVESVFVGNYFLLMALLEYCLAFIFRVMLIARLSHWRPQLLPDSQFIMIGKLPSTLWGLFL